MTSKFLGLTKLLCALALLSSFAAHATTIEQKQSQLLFHALFKVDWPNHPNKNVNLCAVAANEDSVAHQLAKLAGIRSKRHAVEIFFLDDIEEALSFNLENTCQIFYFDSIFSNFNIAPVVELTYGHAILTVGHGDGFLTKGGMLALMGDKPRQAKLAVSTQFKSARLLKVDANLINSTVE